MVGRKADTDLSPILTRSLPLKGRLPAAEVLAGAGFFAEAGLVEGFEGFAGTGLDGDDFEVLECGDDGFGDFGLLGEE
ncbi:hypothetical protein L4X63_14130 [Geomonas sp. Red32]|uniref:hypothetical protein n=1 Tax=Geomonas sp. Red32 TaxID=2912856 RepID=UPI00202CA820|nr:hypothetical protein [Geomonas sp. Red32]MCM0082728.1 hypothetical protein [Geomonas sp. Red32]